MLTDPPGYWSIYLRVGYKEEKIIKIGVLNNVRSQLKRDFLDFCFDVRQRSQPPMRITLQEAASHEASNPSSKAKSLGLLDSYLLEDDPVPNNLSYYELLNGPRHPGGSSTSGYFAAWVRNVYRLYWMIQACGTLGRIFNKCFFYHRTRKRFRK